MKKPDYIPHDYDRIKVVGSLTELFNESFGNANCILYPRRLTGDFNNLARHIAKIGIGNFLHRNIHAPFNLSKEEKQVREDIACMQQVLNDWELKSCPQLRVQSTKSWNPKVSPDAFHIDGARDWQLGRILCNYNAPLTEWVRNEDAVYTKYGNFTAKKGIQINTFGVGDIWRMKCQSKDRSGFIHRTPEAVKNRTLKDAPRMLLVAG